MAVYGFDGNSKGRVEVYSKTDTDSKIDSKISDIYLNAPNQLQGFQVTHTLEDVLFTGLMQDTGNLGQFIVITVPIGLNPSYSNEKVGVNASFMKIWTSNNIHVFDSSDDIPSFINNASLDPELGILSISLQDPSGNYFGLSDTEINSHICIVEFDMLKLTFTANGYKRTT